MADKSRLVRSRAVYRGQITKLQTRVQELFSHNILNEDDQDSINSILFAFQEKLSLVTDLDKQLTDLQSDDDLETFLTEADDYSTQVKETFRKHERQLTRRIVAVDTAMSNLQTPTHSHRHVNLPKLTLQHFDRNILRWSEFLDSFDSAVGSDQALGNVQKFQYLRAQLTGEAAHVISGLPLTDANYTHAIDLLKKRYGQPSQRVNAYMRALWELQKPQYTMDSLRDFHDSLESYIRGLSTLGKKLETYGDLLVPVILDKLPAGVRQQIARQYEDSDLTMDKLRASLLREIKVLRAGTADSTLDDDDDRLHATAAFHTGSYARRSGFRKNNSRSTRDVRITKCAFCKGSHSSTDCTVILDKSKRHDVVVRDRLCYNCLGRHRAADCNSKFRCRVCKRKHHTSLCTESSSKCVNSSNSDCRSSVIGVGRDSNTDETKVSFATSNSPVLLTTAIANISAGGNKTTVAILFDLGSQRSFITQEPADILNLNCTKSEDIKLSTFGKQSNMQSLPLAKFKLHTKASSENLAISALVVPRISTPMRNYVNNSVINLPHIRGLQLAHPYSHSNEDVISVLIGADHYWSIVGDQVIRGPVGPIAISSKLGFLLSGPTMLTMCTQRHKERHTSVYHVNLNTDHDDTFDLQRFWDLESIGILTQELDSVSSHTDYHASYIRKNENRYIAKLPWKHDHEALPTNRELAEKRTRAMVRRLAPDIREAYDKVLKEQISRNFITLVADDDPTTGHYLPHRAVIKESSSTPLRIVYDCSATQNDKPSLNDCLQTGPPLLNDLASILLRFRKHRVASLRIYRRHFSKSD